MGKTDIYKLGYLDPFTDTETVELDMDERRFLAIENQTLALYKIFGNGIIDGTSPSWLIQNKVGDTTGTMVQITPGQGHISFMSAYTLVPTDLELVLPPGADYPIKFYIYATTTDSTPDKGTVNFVASTTIINDPDNYVGLGAVLATAPNGSIILTPYNDVENGRVNISLFSSLTSVVNKHKHIGGANNPAPINLQYHVQGKLSGEHIENLDLSTVTKGTLAPERLPVISHDQLDRHGNLTHPQIDTLLTDLYKHSENRLSDLQLTNTLKLALALYRQEGLADIINKYLETGIIFVPGVNSDRAFAYYAPNDPAHPNGFATLAPYVPTELNLADIDEVNNLIIGKTAGAIEGTDQIFWTNRYDFDLVKSQDQNSDSNVLIVSEDSGLILDVTVDNLEGKFIVANDVQHGFVENDLVSFTGRYLPMNLVANATYYVHLLPGKSEFQIMEKPNGSPLIVEDLSGEPNNLLQVHKLSNAYLTLPKPVDYQGLMLADLTNWKQGYQFIDKSTIDNSDDQFVDAFDISRYLYYEFSALKDISNTNKIGIGYGLSKADSHPGAMSVYFILSDGDNTQQITMPDGTDKDFILSTQVTFHFPDDTVSSSLYKVIDLDNFGLTPEQKIKIKGIGISYNTSNESGWDKNEVYFQLVSPSIQQINDSRLTDPINGRNDESAIFVWNDIAYTSEETMIFRVDTGYSNTKYNLIKYNSEIPAGTQIKITTRVANTSEDLENAVIFNLGSNGEVNGGADNARRVIDVVVKLIADSTLRKAPKLKDLLLSYTGPGATQSPKIWNTARQWYEGELTNIIPQVGPVADSLVLVNSGDVGRYIYLRQNQLFYSFEKSASSYEERLYHDGSELYLSPWQIFSKTDTKGFINPKDTQLTSTGNIIVVDTQNDRVIELDSDGAIVRGIQGNIRLNRINRDFVITGAIYNKTLGKMWITFSQNVSIKDKSKMYLTNDRITMSFGSTNPDDSKDVINVVLFNPIDNKSATLEVTFAKYFLDQINAWTTTPKFIIDSGAVECKGSSQQTTSGGNTTTTDTSKWTIPAYLIGPPNKYRLASTGTLAKMSAGGLPALPSTVVSDSGDFNGDGQVKNSETDTLYGPNPQMTGRITIPVTVGNIIVDNIYEPLSLQLVDGGWLIACVGSNSANFYGSDLVKKWYIPSQYAVLREGVSGAAWKLSNGYVIISTPAPADLSTGKTSGEIVVINKDAGTVSSPAYSIVSRIPVSGDPVKTIPNVTETEFWVAINDRLGNGQNSRIVRVDYSGKVRWSWGNGIVSAPTGMRILDNGDLLISE